MANQSEFLKSVGIHAAVADDGATISKPALRYGIFDL
jgi:hypothetical protein